MYRKVCFGKKRSRNKQKLCQESGMMVIEALFSFTIFIMAVAAIIYLITIYTLHNRIQFAINSTAHELASYSYVYQVLGIRSADKTLESDGASYVKELDDTASQLVDTWNKIEGLQGGDVQLETMQNAADSAEKSVSQVKELLSNPKDVLTGVIYMAADVAAVSAKSTFATWAAEGMTEKYLSVGEDSADAYLKSMGVKDGYEGLDFSGSTMFCDTNKKLIDIVVEYDVDLTFVQLIVPDATLHMVQRVTVTGWLDGDGRTLSQYGVSRK